MNNKKKEEGKLQYARAYIVPQRYKNLYSAVEALNIGTIFADLNFPYKEKKEKENRGR